VIAASRPRCAGIAHFDYWSEKVRRSVLLDAKADMLVFGNAERQICESRIGLRRARRSGTSTTCAARRSCARRLPEGWAEIDSTTIDTPGPLAPPVDPYAMEPVPMKGAALRPRR